MEINPQALYQQAVDKQRIMIVGENKKTIGGMIHHVLKYHKRKVDYIADKQQDVVKVLSDAPVLILEAPEGDLRGFQHHILIITPSTQNSIAELCDSTPKSGIIVFPELDSQLKSIATKERVDVTTIAYQPYKHEKNGDGIALVSSKNEKVPVKFSGAAELEAATAAKEVLKKIGITSQQFYQAIQSF